MKDDTDGTERHAATPPVETGDADSFEAILHALLIRGSASEAELAQMTGFSATTTAHDLDLACSQGAAERCGNWRLSRSGQMTRRAALIELYRQPDKRQPLERLYDAFIRLNEPFKQCCTDWQLDNFGGHNTHDDQRRDARTLANLARIHRGICRELGAAEPAGLRFRRYQDRFENVLKRLQLGEHHAMAYPGGTSYHDIWMELHSDLLFSLGKQRGLQDGH